MSKIYPAETSGWIVTSWLPLTDVGPSVQGCGGSYMWESTRLVAFDPGYGLAVEREVQCLPDVVTAWWNQEKLGEDDNADNTVLSLLPVTCPMGWSTAATSIRSSISTQVLCCPPGYYLYNSDITTTGVAGDCVSWVNSGRTLTYASPIDNSLNSYTSATTTLLSDSTIGAIAVIGWNVQAPMTSSPTITSSPSASSQQASSTATAGSGVPQYLTGNEKKSDALSVGAKAGIGVGVGVGLIAIVLLLAWIWVLKRRNKKHETGAPASNAPSMQQYWINPDGAANPYKPRELAADSITIPPSELAFRRPPAELANS